MSNKNMHARHAKTNKNKHCSNRVSEKGKKGGVKDKKTKHVGNYYPDWVRVLD